jgi:hypothetical protein
MLSPPNTPVSLDVDAKQKMANWRPLVQWFLAIPHYIINYGLNIASQVVSVISWFAIVFTGTNPDGLFRFQVMVLRYQARMNTYAFFLHDTYPPFEFNNNPQDPGGNPVTLSITPPQERNRLTAAFRIILVIPHLILVAIFVIGAFFAGIVAFFSVLFTGNYPPGIQQFIIKVFRYATRVQVYMMLLRDEYPAFGIS